MKPFRRTPPLPAAHGSVSWAAEIVELAAVFLAVGLAHLFVTLVGHHADGGIMLIISGATLAAGAILHRWWGARSRRAQAEYPAQSASHLHNLLTTPVAQRGMWRVRATLADRPGNLAALSGKLAALNVNILAIHIHAARDGVTDELLVAAAPTITVKEISAAVEAGGGSRVHVVPADTHDLVDPPTRALRLAARAAADAGSLPDALAELLPASTVSGQPPGPDGAATAQLRDPTGKPLFLSRPGLPFTPTELARAQALIDLCARLRPHDAPHR